MSYSIIQAVWPGEKHENVLELPNAWGTAPVIWGALTERYLGKNRSQWLAIAAGEVKTNPLWSLWGDTKVPESYRAVHLLTLDRIYVLRKDYPRMAADIRQFVDDFPYGGVNHWPDIASFLETNPEFPAIALHCTTVTEDLFTGRWNVEKQDFEPFDWSTAYSLYDEIESLKKESLKQ